MKRKDKKQITGRHSLSSHRSVNIDHIFWAVIPHDLGNLVYIHQNTMYHTAEDDSLKLKV
jgi:hypothetical protein